MPSFRLIFPWCLEQWWPTRLCSEPTWWWLIRCSICSVYFKTGNQYSFITFSVPGFASKQTAKFILHVISNLSCSNTFDNPPESSAVQKKFLWGWRCSSKFRCVYLIIPTCFIFQSRSLHHHCQESSSLFVTLWWGQTN